MAVEAIRQVRELEEETKRRREAAQTESKQKLLVAQRAAQRLLEDSRLNAEAAARQMMSDAEAEAACQAEKIMEQAGAECEALKQEARRKLPQAVALIVERVVND